MEVSQIERYKATSLDFHEAIHLPMSAWIHGSWHGVRIQKNPCDLMIFQELVYKLKPDFILETGVANGGCTLFWAHMLDLIGLPAMVIGVDLYPEDNLPSHPRIQYLSGSSIDPSIIEQVKHLAVGNHRILVDLDSNHTKDHVLAEMEAYAPLVSTGSYMIVEDTDINGHPVLPEWGDGPFEAVQQFLITHPEFIADRDLEKYGVTFQPGGYLLRTAE
jgi:cephalosporin hydroxylase